MAAHGHHDLASDGTAIVGLAPASSAGRRRSKLAAVDRGRQANGAAIVCLSETPGGRPSPLTLWKAVSTELGIWPARAYGKVHDMAVGIGDGEAAGTGTAGLSATGHGIGLDHAALTALPAPVRRERIDKAATTHRAAGAGYVIDRVADLRPVPDTVAQRIAADEPSL